jgi:hypothetical protein
MRDILRRDIESELKKSADSIDPDSIERRINELCELEARRSGLRPPETTEAQINAVIDRIKARVYRKTPVRRLPPLIRLAAAACVALVCVFFSLFASHYVWVTKRYFREGVKVALCCGTDECQCKIKAEQSGSEQ